MKFMLKKLRSDAGLSQQEMADKLGIPSRTYGAWEREESVINIRQAAAICNVLGCTPNNLVGWPMDGLTHDESDLVKSYKACDTPTRASVLMVAKNGALASASQAEQAPRLDRSEIA